MDNQYLKDAIISYIRNNPDKQLSSIDIVSYFKLRVDITYAALKELENEGCINRHDGLLGGWNEKHYYTV